MIPLQMWITTAILFLIILTIGTLRFRKTIFGGLQHWCGPNSHDISSAWLSEHISKANSSVDIVTGNLNPRVFDKVAKVIGSRLSESQDLEIRMLVSTVILTLANKNELFSLSGEFSQKSPNRFKLAFLRERPTEHFRVLDNSNVYIELPHRVGEECRPAEWWENSIFRAWQYHNKFEELWKKRIESVTMLKFVPLEQYELQIEKGVDFAGTNQG